MAWLERLILPSLAIGAGYSAILMRFVRAGLLEVLGSDYVRTARAKGVRERVCRSASRAAQLADPGGDRHRHSVGAAC